jgi:hypothetical protein
VSDEGVTISPELDYSLGGFTFYVNCEFAGLGISQGDVCITPALGIKYSFKKILKPLDKNVRIG